MANKPKVAQITPGEVSPGDKIEVMGSNFRRGDRVEIWNDMRNEREKRLSKRPTKWVSSEMLRLTIPKKTSSGPKRLAIVRDDKRYEPDATFAVVPLVRELAVTGGTEITIRGRGFTPDSRVVMGDVDLIPTKAGPSRLAVTLPRDLPLADVLAPTVIAAAAAAPMPAMDVTGPMPAMDVTALSGFQITRDGFSFPNDVEYQSASWGTFVETFGEANVKRAKRLPTFMFLWAYYALYTSFFEGVGPFQASGLCSGLTTLCLERFCAGESPANFELQPTKEVRKQLTMRMGRILGREQLALAYDQCKRGLANVATTLNHLQSSLRNGIQLDTAQMLWFLPSGRITERKFLEKLSFAHSVVPFDITGSQIGAAYEWRIPIYDVNMPGQEDVWVEVEQLGSRWSWRHNRDGRFSSEMGMTLAVMPLTLFQKPAEFPFSGPFGLTRFLFDMLL